MEHSCEAERLGGTSQGHKPEERRRGAEERRKEAGSKAVWNRDVYPGMGGGRQYLILSAHHGLQILVHESKLFLQLPDSTGLVHSQVGRGVGSGGRRGQGTHTQGDPRWRGVGGVGFRHALHKTQGREHTHPGACCG